MSDLDRDGERALLASLLARARSVQAGHPLCPSSPLGTSTLPHCTLATAERVRIYRAPRGGWHGDVVFEVPAGVPNVLGSPVGAPLPTRDAAEAFVVHLLACLLVTPPLPPRKPVFLLHGWAFDLEPDILARLAACHVEPAYTAARAAQRLDEIVDELGGLPLDPQSLPQDGYLRLFAACHIAAVCGASRHPPSPTDRRPLKKE